MPGRSIRPVGHINEGSEQRVGHYRKYIYELTPVQSVRVLSSGHASDADDVSRQGDVVRRLSE